MINKSILPPSDEGGGLGESRGRGRDNTPYGVIDYPSVGFADSSPDKGSQEICGVFVHSFLERDSPVCYIGTNNKREAVA